MLTVMVMGGVEEDKDGHDFHIRHAVPTIAALLSRDVNKVFFQFWLKYFAEFIE
jgi:hypothetical protein